jgi:micrococcal nuclease
VALVTLVGLVVLGLVGVLLVDPSGHDVAAPSTAAATLAVLAEVTSAAPTARSIAMPPTITTWQETAEPTDPAPRAGYAAASLPALDPQPRKTSLPTVTPVPLSEPVRTGCDPAYPEERTCIPSGPPLAQPCAITDERNFTVLPPDPRRLDADGDGIGCEPIAP